MSAPKGSRWTVKQTADAKAEINRRITHGQSLAQALRYDEKAGIRMPQLDKFYIWMENDPIFEREHAKARLRQHDLLVDQCLAIADSIEHKTHYHGVVSAKEKIAQIRWAAERAAPRKWGLRQAVEVTQPGIDQKDVAAVMRDIASRMPV